MDDGRLVQSCGLDEALLCVIFDCLPPKVWLFANGEERVCARFYAVGAETVVWMFVGFGCLSAWLFVWLARSLFVFLIYCVFAGLVLLV